MKFEPDLRKEIFRDLNGCRVTAEIRSEGTGILCGVEEALETADSLGLDVPFHLHDGHTIEPESILMCFTGTPRKVLMAEEVLMGRMAKPSGIATAAHKFSSMAAGRFQVVAGAWKKMPLEIKHTIRKAVALGGAGRRACEEPFVYLDKNYTAIFGGIAKTLQAVSHLAEHVKVIHIRGAHRPLVDEAVEAANHGACIIFIDTGSIAHIDKVSSRLTQLGLRRKMKIAFGGNVQLDDFPFLLSKDLDMVDIGRAIVDAPLLDMRMEVVEVDSI